MRFKGPITDKTFLKKKNKVRGFTMLYIHIILESYSNQSSVVFGQKTDTQTNGPELTALK